MLLILLIQLILLILLGHLGPEPAQNIAAFYFDAELYVADAISTLKGIIQR